MPPDGTTAGLYERDFYAWALQQAEAIRAAHAARTEKGANDWRVDLSEEQVKELKKQAEATFTAVQKEGLLEMYGNLHALLEHAKDRLADPEAVFRDSLIKNIREMVARLSKLNVTGDKELEAVRKETEAAFKDVAPADLRDNKEKRAKVAKDAGAIMKKMASYMGAAKKM